MSVNLLAIDVGNSRTHLGCFQDGKLTTLRHLHNLVVKDIAAVAKELYAPIQDAEDAAIYLASVNDPVAAKVGMEIQQALGKAPLRMESDVPVPIGRQLDPETIVGEDRLLNAAAAWDKYKAACIVISAGTAMTVDFVDGVGVFHGGAILTGANMMLAALHERTAQLPAVTLVRPEEAIGRNTTAAILSGVYHGLRGAARELAEKYAEYYQAYPKIVATGGDAELLFKGYDLIDAIVPELTLLGMAVAHRQAMNPEE